MQRSLREQLPDQRSVQERRSVHEHRPGLSLATLHLGKGMSVPNFISAASPDCVLVIVVLPSWALPHLAGVFYPCASYISKLQLIWDPVSSSGSLCLCLTFKTFEVTLKHVDLGVRRTLSNL